MCDVFQTFSKEVFLLQIDAIHIVLVANNGRDRLKLSLCRYPAGVSVLKIRLFYIKTDQLACVVGSSGSPVGSGAPGSPEQDVTAAATARFGETPADYEPRTHRLQRQDAKSRKTFKIKRHRSTIKGNIIRSATVKGPLRVCSFPCQIVQL